MQAQKYIEVAEFDCLHDDGVLYASLLQEEGIPVKLYETEGTMHGYDIRRGATETKRMIATALAATLFVNRFAKSRQKVKETS